MKKHLTYLAIIGVVLFSACEKVIDVDLGNSGDVLVIEAIVQDGVSAVKLSRSADFDNAGAGNFVTGGVVIVTDASGNSFPFAESSTGNFENFSLTPVVGETYTLNVALDGENYRATGTMPEPVSLDTLIFEAINNPFADTVEYSLDAYYQDPPSVESFYQFRFGVNGFETPGFYVTDDVFNDGLYTYYPIFEESYVEGDTAFVELLSITEEVHDFLVVLEGNTEDAGIFSGAPADPDAFFGRADVLGYFSVQSSNQKTMIVSP